MGASGARCGWLRRRVCRQSCHRRSTWDQGWPPGWHLAAALPELGFDCGLGTPELFADHLVPLSAGAALDVGSLPDPDHLLLAEAESRADAGVRAAWLARLAEAWHAGLRNASRIW